MDTLRRDALGLYNEDVWWTPTIDSLGASGVVWDDARTVFSITQPSHASMMTGRYPSYLGTVSNSSTLQARFSPIARELSAEGYRCGAFVNTWVLDKKSGLNHGFHTYVRAESELLDTPRTVEKGGKIYTVERVYNPSAMRTVKMAGRWLEKSPEPFFLWLHFMDPHLDYTPPDSILRYLGYENIDPKFGRREFLSGRHKRGLPFSKTAITKIRNLYAGEVVCVDKALSSLFTWLRAYRRNTIVVLVSDHGENICDDGTYVGHAYSLHESVVRIPLIISGRNVPPGIRMPTPVDLTQLKPTFYRILDFHDNYIGSQDLFSSEEKVLFCKDLRGRTACFFAGWQSIREDAGGESRIIRRGKGDSTVAIAKLDSAFLEFQSQAIHPVERSINPDEEEKLRALGYTE